jgi:Uma2 family endonuclease
MERQQTTSTAVAKNFIAPAALPRLEAGDHLDQPTFHARYEAMPSSFRAELVEGVVIVPSPLLISHGDAHNFIMGWLFVYRARTPAVRSLDNATTILSEESEPQPDGSLILDVKCGGQTRDQDGYLLGPPELIVEVASTSESYDLHSKFRLYESAGVREYLVIVLRDKRARWFVLQEGKFVESPADEQGIVRSTIFPGLWLDAPALFAGDAAKLLATLDRGLATPEHAAQAAAWKQLLERSEPQASSSD